jgi:glycosyltransferase involved in cell wall biosynthesis
VSPGGHYDRLADRNSPRRGPFMDHDAMLTTPSPDTTDAPARAESPVPVDSARLLVVIPAFNEEGRIAGVIADLRDEVPAAEILVVDDGSTDATAREARDAGALVLTLPLNLGYGAALQTGYKYALRNDFDLVAQIDGDGQHQASFLPKLLAELENPHVHVAIGSRFLDGDGHYKPSNARKLGMALFGRIATIVTRQRVSDPTSGFQAMRIDVARFFCSSVYPTDYPDADILILLHRSGYGVREVAVRMLPPAGKSMHGGHRSLYYVYKMSLSILVTLLRKGTRR